MEYKTYVIFSWNKWQTRMLCITQVVSKQAHKLFEWSGMICFFPSSASPADLSLRQLLFAVRLCSQPTVGLCASFITRGNSQPQLSLRKLGANEGAVHAESLFFCWHFYFFFVFIHNFRFNARLKVKSRGEWQQWRLLKKPCWCCSCCSCCWRSLRVR